MLFGLDIIFFFSAIKLTTVANATIVGALQPALLLYVGARWFGEQVNTALIGLTVVAITGAGHRRHRVGLWRQRGLEPRR